MATQHCIIAKNPHATEDEIKKCPHGCQDFACCLNTEGGEIHYNCVAQMRKRLGGDVEPGDKCGSCGTHFQ